jgi:four helix bundle protein
MWNVVLRTFDLAVTFYRQASALRLPVHLKDQLSRASSSVALNLAEGRGKSTRRDQLRFFHIALGSARESQAVLILADLVGAESWMTLDHLVASLYRLIERAR